MCLVAGGVDRTCAVGVTDVILRRIAADGSHLRTALVVTGVVAIVCSIFVILFGSSHSTTDTTDNCGSAVAIVSCGSMICLGQSHSGMLIGGVGLTAHNGSCGVDQFARCLTGCGGACSSHRDGQSGGMTVGVRITGRAGTHSGTGIDLILALSPSEGGNIAMTLHGRAAILIAVTTDGTGVGGVTHRGTGRYSHHAVIGVVAVLHEVAVVLRTAQLFRQRDLLGRAAECVISRIIDRTIDQVSLVLMVEISAIDGNRFSGLNGVIGAGRVRRDQCYASHRCSRTNIIAIVDSILVRYDLNIRAVGTQRFNIAAVIDTISTFCRVFAGVADININRCTLCTNRCNGTILFGVSVT